MYSQIKLFSIVTKYNIGFQILKNSSFSCPCVFLNRCDVDNVKGKCRLAEEWGLWGQYHLEKGRGRRGCGLQTGKHVALKRCLRLGPLTSTIYLIFLTFAYIFHPGYFLVLPQLSLGTPQACPSYQLPISRTFLGSLFTNTYIMWLNDVSSLVPLGDLLCYSTSSLVIKSSLNPHFTAELSLQWAKLWRWGLIHPE